jgi:hypothetical protein
LFGSAEWKQDGISTAFLVVLFLFLWVCPEANGTEQPQRLATSRCTHRAMQAVYLIAQNMKKIINKLKINI